MMSDEQHLAILRQGVLAWNTWRRQQPRVQPDLRGADLRKMGLYGINFDYTELSGARLDQASLCDVSLLRARLIDTILLGTILFKGRCHYADFTGANLEGAYWYQIRGRSLNLTLAQARQASLRECMIQVRIEGTQIHVPYDPSAPSPSLTSTIAQLENADLLPKDYVPKGLQD